MKPKITEELKAEAAALARRAADGERPGTRSDELTEIFAKADQSDLLLSICREEGEKVRAAKRRGRNPFFHFNADFM